MRDHPKTTFRRVLNELGYEDFDSFLSQNNCDFKEEKFKVVLMVKQASRSHAWNYWSVDDVDLAIVYCRSTFGIAMWWRTKYCINLEPGICNLNDHSHLKVP